MALNHVTLDDKYDLTKSRIFVTGFQAIVRLCLMQKERDRRAGLNTAGYVTGYRGSPLGTLDLQFIRAQRPHAGFGLGLERTVQWICGREHVREASPFPRMMYRKEP